MKTTIIVLVTSLFLSGCSLFRNNDWYVYSHYPECQQCTSRADFINCVNEIRLMEGKAR
jgi:hypothetical protein